MKTNISIFMIIFFFCVVATSCRHSFNVRLCSVLDENTLNKDSMTIRMDSVTDFLWDTMYVFDGTISPKDIWIKYRIKVQNSRFDDDGALYVFLKKSKIVHEEMVNRHKCACGLQFSLNKGRSKAVVYKVFKIKSDNYSYKGKRNYYVFDQQ